MASGGPATVSLNVPAWRAARTARARALVALARYRLGRTPGARIGLVCAVVSALVFGAIASVMTARRSQGADLDGIVRAAGAAVAWLGAGPIALAAAHDRGGADRRDGIDALAAARGLRDGALDGARLAATIAQTLVVVGVPLAGFSLAVLAASRTVMAFTRGAVMAVAFAVFAVSVAVTTGITATACGRAFGARGRAALLAVVIVPWALAEAAGHPAWSIPGALGALLDVSVDLAGGHLR